MEVLLFTGIIKDLGCICSIEDILNGRRLMLETSPEFSSDLILGSSIAINGVCLTVISTDGGKVSFDLIRETLEKTALFELKVGDHVHLERSLRLGDECGGHLLSGHVFGTGLISRIRTNSFFIKVPLNSCEYFFEKGFVAVDGVGLTVVEVCNQDHIIRVDLIPETLRVTLLNMRKEGEKVNIEVDFITQGIVETTKRFLTEKLLQPYLNSGGMMGLL